MNREKSSDSIVPRGAQELAAAPVLSALPRDAPCFVRTELPPLPAAALPKSPHLLHKQRGGVLSGHASTLFFFFFQRCADEINFALLKARQIFPACPRVHKKKSSQEAFPLKKGCTQCPQTEIRGGLTLSPEPRKLFAGTCRPCPHPLEHVNYRDVI